MAAASREVAELLQPQTPRFFQPRNEEKTQELLRDEKYRRYVTWLECFGAVFPKLEFPVAFGPLGLVGVAAKDDIPRNCGLLYVPYSLCITYAKARESELREMLETQSLFKEEEEDWLDYALYSFLVRERIKGTSSFYYPYFCVTEEPEMLLDWTPEELRELHDQFLYHKALYFREKMRKKWKILSTVFAQYPNLFPPADDLENLFYWAYKMLHTRSFAWGKPEGMLAPFADNLNHADINLTYKTTFRDSYRPESDPGGVQPAFCMPQKLYMNRMCKFIHTYHSTDSLSVVDNIWETDPLLQEFESSSEENSDGSFSESDSDAGNEGEEDSESEEEFPPCADAYPTLLEESHCCFSIWSGDDTSFQAGSQVFNCYGRHSNGTLLLYYGFAMFGNHHDSLLFKLWNPDFEERVISLTNADLLSKTYKESLGGRNLSDLAVTFKLQKGVLNEKVISFHRTKIIAELERDRDFGMKIGNLPKDEPTTELIEVSCLQRVLSVYLLLQHNRLLEDTTGDRARLERNEELPYRLRFAMIYRVCQGEILSFQITLVRKLMDILKAVQSKVPLSNAHLSRKTAEEFYWTYPMRNYLKQFSLNKTKWESGLM